jgi:hypothetical protein
MQGKGNKDGVLALNYLHTRRLSPGAEEQSLNTQDGPSGVLE